MEGSTGCEPRLSDTGREGYDQRAPRNHPRLRRWIPHQTEHLPDTSPIVSTATARPSTRPCGRSMSRAMLAPFSGQRYQMLAFVPAVAVAVAIGLVATAPAGERLGLGAAAVVAAAA